jgi:hypothetical protein
MKALPEDLLPRCTVWEYLDVGPGRHAGAHTLPLSVEVREQVLSPGTTLNMVTLHSENF